MEDTPQGPQDSAPPPPPPPAEPTPPPPQEPAAKEIVSENRNVMIVLSYLWLLALIPLLVEKDDEVVVMIGLQVIVMILGAISGGLGCVFTLLIPIFMLAILIVHILCIVKAINGGRFLIPGVSEFADKF
jgi:uncharacterized membrane protein